MTPDEIKIYTQSLLDKIVVMTKEIDNLRAAYITVDSRLNKLSLLTEINIKELVEEASKVEDFAKLAVEASKLTEESALITNNLELIQAAKKSSSAACAVHQLAVDLRVNKLSKLEPKRQS